MIRLAVRCEPALAERVLAELIELVPGGVEEERGDGYVEFAIYGPPGELPELPDLEVAAGDGLVAIETTEIPDDWADRWRDFHRPVAIGDGRLVVRPSWEAGPPADPATPGREAEDVPGIDPATPGREAEDVPARLVSVPHTPFRATTRDVHRGIHVVIDPGQAFGTGAHATARLSLELLVELADGGAASGSLADLGTGSGVLAIAASKLGWAPVRGCDHERPALAAAAANAALNGVELGLERVNLREAPPPPARTWVANLTAPLLAAVAAGLVAGAVEPPRVLICSGMLAGEEGGVAAGFGRAGLAVRARRRSGDWAALRLDLATDRRPA